MKRFLAASLLLLVAVLTTSARAEKTTASGQHWVCPPCATPCDTLVFDAPGTCPTCGMALVEQSSAAAAPPKDQRKVAILVFNGVEIIDSMGPYEVFGAAGCDVYTVAATKDPVTTAMGAQVVPRYTFADAPPPDVLVVPGGGVKKAAQDPATLKYVTETTARDQHTMSVCNGAFILAQAGLLDGLTATTTSGNIDRLRETFPKIKVVEDQRYVDNGKIITTAGLSAGIDGALHVVSVLMGEGTAQQVALGEEYDLKGRAGYARAALADRNIPDIKLDDTGDWHCVRTEGDTGHWQVEARGRSKQSAAQLMDVVGQALEKGKWRRAAAVASQRATSNSSAWRFVGRDGKPWTGVLEIAPVAGQEGEFTAKLAIAHDHEASASR